MPVCKTCRNLGIITSDYGDEIKSDVCEEFCSCDRGSFLESIERIAYEIDLLEEVAA